MFFFSIPLRLMLFQNSLSTINICILCSPQDKSCRLYCSNKVDPVSIVWLAGWMSYVAYREILSISWCSLGDELSWTHRAQFFVHDSVKVMSWNQVENKLFRVLGHHDVLLFPEKTNQTLGPECPSLYSLNWMLNLPKTLKKPKSLHLKENYLLQYEAFRCMIAVF